jgi:fibronectin type 3 domain-containing protein
MRKPSRPTLSSWLTRTFSCPRRNQKQLPAKRTRLEVECLEIRTMPSGSPIHHHADIAHTNYVVLNSGTLLTPLAAPASAPYAPIQIQSAYGFNLISENGAGQTIAIVDAYDDPTIQGDLQAFDQYYGLPAANLTVVNQTGGSALPSPDIAGGYGWEVETALDVEWAHALAPGANLLLVEANSANTNDLFAGASYAASQHATLGVSVVSMSFGAGEYSTETADDSSFKTAATSGGVTFLAGTGDSGYPANYPALSPYVTAVGGTSLQIDINGAYVSETGWSGSGGSISKYEAQPSYQKGVVTQSSTKRTAPDVSFDADPNTGVYIYDSDNNPYGGPWTGLGGTSFATPAWAAIVAISNQIRAQAGQTSTLNGYTDTLPDLYKLPASDFHDITSGNNGHYSAGTGYDLVTGRGSPIVNKLAFDLAGVGTVPVGLTAVAGERQVSLSWAAQTQTGTTFNIYRGTSPGGESATPVATGVTTTSFTDTGLTDGTTYYYEVAAVNSGVVGTRSSEVSAKPMVQPPSSVVATPSDKKVVLTWTASPGAASYSIFRGTSHNGEGATPVATGVTATSFMDTGLTDGTTYYYYVEAVNALGPSAPSSEVSATPVPPPAAPTGVTATPGHTQITLSWTASPGAATYSVYRGTSPNGEGATAIATGVTATSFTDIGLTDGTTYYYKVTAVGTGGESGPSGEVSATSQFLILAIDAGGSAVGSFIADTDYVGGTTYNSGAVVDTSGVSQPAPQAVYQTVRYVSSTNGSFSYVLPGLTPGASYTVRLQFADPVITTVGGRVFNVTLNGAAFLTNFDIFALTGVVNKAIAEVGTTTADANGQITIVFAGLYPEVASIEILAPTPVTPPAAPATLSATASIGQVALSWSPVARANSYNLYRSTTPGGEGSTPYQTGLTGTTFTDIHVTGGTAYYYQVAAVNLGGPGSYSTEQSATPQSLPPYLELAIDAGGSAVGSFVADTDFVGGITYSSGTTVDTSGVLQPAPQAVYQTVRYVSSTNGSFSYVLPGLTPGASYTVRLQFADPVITTVGGRVFNVTLNGAAFLTNFDIFALTGAVNKAIAEAGTTTADANGQITIVFAGLYPEVASIEIFGATPVAPPAAPATLSATAGVGQVALSWSSVAGANSYNLYRSTTPGGEGSTPYQSGLTGTTFTDINVTGGTTYYYQVAAVNLGGAGTRTGEQSATPQSLPPYLVLAIDAGGSAVGSFVADTDFVGGLTYSSSATVDTSGVAQPSPQAVYQNVRYASSTNGSFSYVLPGLTPGASYTVLLQFADPVITSVGGRVFNVTLNGTAFLTNFDIFALTGAVNKAIAEAGATTADASGQITINFFGLYPEVASIEIFASTPVAPPAAPASLSASGDVGQVALSWSSVVGASSYNLYRSTTPGGEGSTPYRSGLTGTTFTDVNVTNGTTYYYQVAAVNLGGAGTRAGEKSATPQSLPPYLVLAIDAGGSAVGSFAADTDFVGGTTYNSGTPVDTSGVSQPAPQAVYQTVRYVSSTNGSFSYVLPGLTPGASYTVRLQFADPVINTVGGRVFNVTLNGAAFLTNFDIFAVTGEVNKAIAEVGTTTADANGQITINFVGLYPEVASIEIYAATPVAPPAAPASLSASAGVGQVVLNWSPVVGAGSYNLYRSTTPGGEGSTPYLSGLTGSTFTDTSVTNGTTYYYQVAAVNLGGAGTHTGEQSATPQNLPPYLILAIDAGGAAAGSFAADTDFVGGTTYNSGATVDTSGVTQPAPQAVYQTVRYASSTNGSFSYVLPGLTPGATYTVRLQFADPVITTVGGRVFNVTLNGAAFLTNFDIFALTGAVNKAIAEVGTTTADSNGQITINFVGLYPEVASIQIYAATPVAPLPAPATLSATANVGQVALSWSSVVGATSYNLYRSTTPGGEGSTPYQSGLTGTTYTDTNVTNGTTYYYQVAAVNLGGPGNYSGEQSATPQNVPPYLVMAIDAGGSAVGSFAADTGFVGGSTYNSGATVDTSGVSQPAPQAVYQTVRYASSTNGSFSYVLSGLTPGASYTIRLQFVDPVITTVGGRVFNVTLNGAAFLTNFDIFALTGEVNKAIAEVGTTTADANGQITINFFGLYPEVASIEVFSSTPPG